MDFVSLAEAVEAIADHIQVGPPLESRATFPDAAFQAAADSFWQSNRGGFERWQKQSHAAYLLNRALHYPDTRKPRWFAYSQTKRFHVQADETASTGIDLLTRQSNHAMNVVTHCASHVREASATQDPGRLDTGFPRSIARIKPEELRASLEIGFLRNELVALLDQQGIRHTLMADMPSLAAGNPAASTTTKRPATVQEQQEEMILRAVRALGFDPVELEPIENGKRGVKAQVRASLTFSVKVFDKAWERLRATGRIREKERPRPDS